MKVFYITLIYYLSFCFSGQRKDLQQMMQIYRWKVQTKTNTKAPTYIGPQINRSLFRYITSQALGSNNNKNLCNEKMIFMY